MDSSFIDFVKDVWHYKPIIVVLAIVGLIIFIPLVIDTYFYRKRRKKRHHKKR